ncbi:MAG: universal stress protein [Cyanobacteria bacterium SW_9_44_58]|nr:MAG: universal stress protein [Cyanobacteria bacterium SW_9_44_58]
MSLFQRDRVLVLIDFSESCFQALEETMQEMDNPESVHILHVLRPLNPADPGIIWHTVDHETRRRHVKKAFYKRCGTPPYEKAPFTVLIGKPAKRIIDYAKENKIQLIIIPSHAHKGLNRFALGSVAERVVRQAPCPVLVLRE